jgi:hypothetical protein
MEKPEVNITWEQFHDSTIQEIQISLDKEVVVIKLTTAEHYLTGISSTSIIAEKVKFIICPILKPWGRSISINEITDNGERLEIEMQSGDTIVIEAEAFNILKE